MDDSVLLSKTPGKHKKMSSENRLPHVEDREFNLDTNENRGSFAVREDANCVSDIKKTFPNRNQKFSSIFLTMRDTSKYANLCSEFKIYLKSNEFLNFIESYSTLKMSKNTLERVSIPQFRDLKIKSGSNETETKNYSLTKDEEESPISVNNKRILCFIVVLVMIFVTAILFIFLSN